MPRLKFLKCKIQTISYVRNFGKTAQNNKPGWFEKGAEKQLETRPQGKEIYELVIDDVKPECWKRYIGHQGDIRSLFRGNGINVEFVNTWKFVAGDVTSKAVQLIKYGEGWKDLDFKSKTMRSDPKLSEANGYGNTLINSQSTEILKSYRFWQMSQEIEKDENNIYELSSYALKPGSMYDWTNYWVRGLKCRQSVRNDIAYAGLFTQLGQLHKVYHIWCYKDYQDRSECRKLTWQQEDWSEIVTETGELVTTMKSGILEPIKIA